MAARGRAEIQISLSPIRGADRCDGSRGRHLVGPQMLGLRAARVPEAWWKDSHLSRREHTAGRKVCASDDAVGDGRGSVTRVPPNCRVRRAVEQRPPSEMRTSVVHTEHPGHVLERADTTAQT